MDAGDARAAVERWHFSGDAGDASGDASGDAGDAGPRDSGDVSAGAACASAGHASLAGSGLHPGSAGSREVSGL